MQQNIINYVSLTNTYRNYVCIVGTNMITSIAQFCIRSFCTDIDVLCRYVLISLISTTKIKCLSLEMNSLNCPHFLICLFTKIQFYKNYTYIFSQKFFDALISAERNLVWELAYTLWIWWEIRSLQTNNRFPLQWTFYIKIIMYWATKSYKSF